MPSRFETPPRVSVVLATYNRAQYIDEAIRSLISQTRSIDELLVVDDGSTDDTKHRVAQYALPVRYVRKDNGGKASALNLGLSHVTGDWLCFFDDDDVALPDALERMLSTLESDPAADFAYSGQIFGREGPRGEIVRERFVSLPDVDPKAMFHYALKDFPFLMQGMLVRRACVEEVGAFDPRYLRGQDYEFCTRLLRRFHGVPVRGPTFIWRVHDGPRGPKQAQHPGTRRGKVWRDYSGMMARELRETLTLGEFLSPPQITEPTAAGIKRRALVHRMAVMASKGLVPEMLEDLRAAAEVGVAAPEGFGPEEAKACFRAATSESFQAAFLDAPRETTRSLASSAGSRGRDVLAYLGRGLMWSGRAGNSTVGTRVTLLVYGFRLLLEARRWPSKVG